MAEILVTAGLALSQMVDEGSLCKTMREMMQRPEDTELICVECGVCILRTSLHDKPSLIASVPRAGKTCQTVDEMRRKS